MVDLCLLFEINSYVSSISYCADSQCLQFTLLDKPRLVYIAKKNLQFLHITPEAINIHYLFLIVFSEESIICIIKS
jgi:hypothetical protein